MIGISTKTKKIVSIAAVLLVAALAALYFIKMRLPHPQEEAAAAENGSYSSLPEEPDYVVEEWIAVPGAPYSVYFRKYTCTLLACEITKDLGGQPMPTSTMYHDEIEYDESGAILNGFSYVHVTFRQKNETAEEVLAFPNAHRLFASPHGEELCYLFLEPSMMNREEGLDTREYYHTQLGPGEEFECKLTYIIPDSYLTEEYDLHFAFMPNCSVEYVPLGDGRQKIVWDAKILLLDSIIEGKTYDQEASGDVSSVTHSAEENLHFWEKGEEKVEYRRIRDESRLVEYTELEFLEPVYLRDYEQLREIAELYELPIFRLCSPFDGSDPSYIKIEEGRIICCFPIPGENQSIKIMWSCGYFGGEKYDAAQFSDIYERYRKSAQIQGVSPDLLCSYLEGEDPILCLFQSGQPGITPGYILEWGYRDILFAIENIIPPNDKALLETLGESISKRTYLKSSEPEFAAGERSYTDLTELEEIEWTEYAQGETAPFGSSFTICVDAARLASEQEVESWISKEDSISDASNTKGFLITVTIANAGESAGSPELSALELRSRGDRKFGSPPSKYGILSIYPDGISAPLAPGERKTYTLPFTMNQYSFDEETWENFEITQFQLEWRDGYMKYSESDGNYAIAVQIE